MENSRKIIGIFTENSGSEGPLFCFESSYWPRCVQAVIELKGVYRQSDPIFVGT